MTGPSSAPPRVAVVLVNWNAWADCIECLDTLWASDYEAFDVYVVDNASRDDSLAHIAHWCAAPRRLAHWRRFDGVAHHSDGGSVPIAFDLHDAPPPAPLGRPDAGRRLHLVRAGANLGFAGGNNVGMRAAGLSHYAYFWLLNTDTVVRRDALSQLVRRARADAQAGIVGSTLRHYDEPDRLQAMGGARMDPRTTAFWCIGGGQPASAVPMDPAGVEAQMAYVVGASMLVDGRFVRDIGYMQEDYFLYFEEPDWAWRARERYRMAYAPGSHVFHKVGGSSAKVASLYSLNLLYRNRIRFMARFLPERLGATRRDMWRHMLGLARRLHLKEAFVIAKVLRQAGPLSRSVQPATRQ